MNYKDNDIINNLVYELKLHDANLIMIKLVNKELFFYVSCKGMGINYYYNEIEDIVLEFHIKEIKNVTCDFDGDILINCFRINKIDDIFTLKIDNDVFFVECLDFDIRISNVKRISINKYEALDNLLKSDI